MHCFSSRVTSWLTRTLRVGGFVLRRHIGASVIRPLHLGWPTQQQRRSQEAVAVLGSQTIPWDRHRQIERKVCTIVGGVVSPALGGVILSTVGWHAIFLVMVAYGIVVVLVLGFGVRETNRTPDPTKAHPSQIARSYLILLRDRGFMRAGLLLGLMLGGIYTLAVLLPFVMIDLVGLTPTQFGLAMICQTGSYMLGAAVTGRALAPYPSDAPHPYR